MLPSTNKGAGMNIGFPDVCLTPAGPAVVPVPYPNLAMTAQAAPFSPIVKTSMIPALNMASMIPLTTGDEGGVAHPLIKGPGMFTMGNPKVYIDKLPGINLTCPSTGNGMNNGLGAVLVPSVSTVFYTLAAAGADAGPGAPAPHDPHARRLDLPALRALADALAQPLCAPVMLEGGIGYIRIQAFSPTVPSEAWSAFSDLARRGMRGLVLDLSGCPGGDVDACLELAGDFLPAGALLATMHEADGDEAELRSRASEPFSWPLAIVTDGLTASAAEIFAGCLAAHGRAVLVGARTYGKGSGQKVVTEESGAQRSMSVAEFTLPDGRRIEGVGLSPDIEATSPEEARTLAHTAVLARCI